MISKIALVLVALVVLAGALSRWRKPPKAQPGANEIEAARKCPDCGTYLIGQGPCPCADRPAG